MSDKGGLQLLPDTRKKITLVIPGENRLIYIGAILCIIVAGTWAGVYAYDNSLNKSISEADANLAKIESQRNKDTEQKLTTLAKQVSITGQILSDHIYWSTALSHIESALEGSVQFKSFSAILSENNIHIRALADNYATIARQVASFASDQGITDINLENVSVLTSGKLDFNAKIHFDPKQYLGAQNQTKQ